ncbi:MAG: hypothetical protein ACD_76C00053G0002 [uncultured bacterium]|nr:MAG: hypothetical protein ACD_76C00053G0002 [uncultured bacterium]HBD05628.1 hypothetical protein [Candidatus Uhrbacteria bacterium]
MSGLNLLENQGPEQYQYSQSERLMSKTQKILIVLLLVFSALAISSVFGAAASVSSAFAGKAAIERAGKAAGELDFDTASKELDVAEKSFKRALSRSRLMVFAKPIPWVGKQINASQGVLRVSLATVEVVRDVLGVARQVSSVAPSGDLLGMLNGVSAAQSYKDMPKETKRRILEELSRSIPELQKLQIDVGTAMRAYNAIPKYGLAGPISDALLPFAQTLPALSSGLELFVPLASVIPEFAGLGGQKNFLILFENNSEIRPAGGFIGTYGVLSVEDGDIKDFYARDVYSLDKNLEKLTSVPVPAPLSRYLGISSLYMRDANWPPDFPTSSQRVLELFKMESSVDPEQDDIMISGLIALTPEIGEDLLRVTGPISSQGIEFTPENFRERLQYEVEFGFARRGETMGERKEIFTELLDEMRNRLSSLPAEKWDAVFSAFNSGLDKKFVRIFSNDAQTQKSISALGWSGEISAADGDYLQIVDANLGSLKSNPFVERNIIYSITKTSEGKNLGTVKIEYKHKGEFSDTVTRYRTYTRVYVPQGSRFIKAEGAMLNDRIKNPELKPGDVDTYQEFGKTAFGAFISIEPQETGVLTIYYELPESVANQISKGSYSLLVQKQNGGWPFALTLDLSFDKNVSFADPSEDSSEFGDGKYKLNTIIDQDKEFYVQFE